MAEMTIKSKDLILDDRQKKMRGLEFLGRRRNKEYGRMIWRSFVDCRC
jgi:hypothetical protein